MKSTVDDLLASYRLGQKLRKAHKEKLIALLMEDLAVQKPIKAERKKKRGPIPDDEGAL